MPPSGAEGMEHARRIVWDFLDNHGLKRGTFARKIGIHQSTLSRSLGNPELGVAPTSAIGPKSALAIAQYLTAAGVKQETIDEFLEGTGVSGRSDRDSTIARDTSIEAPSATEIQLHPMPNRAEPSSSEYWLWSGDSAANAGDYLQALSAYKAAQDRMTRHDQQWARSALERTGQMLVNLNDFDSLQLMIDEVEELYLTPFVSRWNEPDPTIQMLINEKLAWSNTWQGEAQLAFEHARSAHVQAQQLAGEVRIEATALHFIVRSQVESLTTLMLFDKISNLPPIDASSRQKLEVAERYLAQAKALEQRMHYTPAVAFNAQWEARVLRAMGGTGVVEARSREREWRGLLVDDELAAEAMLDYAKTVLIDVDVDRREALHAVRDILIRCQATFEHSQYAPGLADVAITESYLIFLSRSYRTDHRLRQHAAALCTVALCLHPFQQHVLYKLAQRLLSVFVLEMADSEFATYLAEILHRLAEARDAPFRLLRARAFTRPDITGQIPKILLKIRAPTR